MKDIVIRIEFKKCPMCATELSDIAGLRLTANGEEWVQTCNNRKCGFEVITPVSKRIYSKVED